MPRQFDNVKPEVVDNDLRHYENNIFSTVSTIPSVITLYAWDGVEILRLDSDDKIYVRGEVSNDDKAIADALRQFLQNHNETNRKRGY